MRLAIAGHLLAFLAIWVPLAAADSLPGLAVWIYEGGAFVVSVALLSVVQLVVGTLLARRHLRSAVPMAAHLALPAAISLVGVIGTLVGLDDVGESLLKPTHDHGDMWVLWGQDVAISVTPQALAYLVAASGFLSVAWTATAGLAGRVGSAAAPLLRSPRRNLAAWLAAGLGLIAASLVVARLFAWQVTSRPGLAALAWAVVPATAGVALLAVNARAAKSLVPRRRDDAAFAFGAALLSVIAAVGSLAAVCASVGFRSVARLLIHTINAPPEDPKLWFVGFHEAAAAYVATTVGGVSLGFAVLLFGGGVLVASRRGAIPWATTHLADGTATVMLLCTVLAVSWLPGHEARGQLAVLRAQNSHLMPHHVDLPTSRSSGLRMARRTVELVGPRRGDLVFVGYTGYRLFLDGRHFSSRLPISDAAADGEPTVVDELSWEFHRPAWATPYSDDCRLGVAALAADRDAPARQIERFVRRWRARGGCLLQLLVDEPTDERQRAASRFGLLGDFEAARYEPRTIDLNLEMAMPTQGDGDVRPMRSENLVLTLSDAAIHVAIGRGDARTLPRENGRLPLEELSELLVAITGVSPDDESTVFVRATETATMQELVSLLDTARETDDTNGDRRFLFHAAVWLLSDDAGTDGERARGTEERSTDGGDEPAGDD